MAPRAAPRRLKKQQSTLTQLDFVSTPYSTSRSTVDVEGDDEDDWIQREARPRKRQRRNGSYSSRIDRPCNNTLTQIGFVRAGQEQIDDEDIDEEEGRNDNEVQIVADSQPTSIAGSIPGSPASSTHYSVRRPSYRASSPALDPSGHFRIPITPKHRHGFEARSSQTPPSIVLSSAPGSRRRPVEAPSPTKPRTANFLLSPSERERRQVKRTNTVQDSQYSESPIKETESTAEEHDELLDQIRTVTGDRGLAAEEFEERSDGEDGNDTVQTQNGTQVLAQQCTFDPAQSALDRDAARCRWTQLMQTRSLDEVGETQQPHARSQDEESQDHLSGSASPLYEEGSSAETSPAHRRPSQMSTVLPTQSSPRPPPSSIEITTPPPRKQSLRQLHFDDPPSSSLPAPPWTESERVDWVQVTGDRPLPKLDNNHSLADFSLPLPPQIDWASIASSLKAREPS